MKLPQVESCPRLRGRKELVAHLKGKKTTRRAAMAAKCFECMGGFIDGAMDCRISDCPLYPWMPYRSHFLPVNTPNPDDSAISDSEKAESP